VSLVFTLTRVSISLFQHALSLLSRHQLGESITTIPTIGFNVETVDYHNISFTVWDVGGQDRIRQLWRHYYEGTQGLIFVVDSNDTGRFDEAARELHKLLSEDALRNAKVLILANKQDLPKAAKVTFLKEKLRLNEVVHHEWFIQPCSATENFGLYEGLDWLAQALKSRHSTAR